MQNYKFFVPKGPGIGTSYSIAATEKLTEEELAILRTYLARQFELKNLQQFPYENSNEDGLIVIGPNLRHATPESSKRVDGLHRSGLGKIIQVELFDVYLNGNSGVRKADRMRENVYHTTPEIRNILSEVTPDTIIDFLEYGKDSLVRANKIHRIGLTPFDIEEVCVPMFAKYNRNPRLSELFTVAVVNSEHGRHHTIKGIAEIDGVTMPHSLMDLIVAPYKKNPGDSAIAFGDNSSALHAYDQTILVNSRVGKKAVHLIYSAETHNHPTTIEAFHGAITGTDGEERDIWGMGKGAQILLLVSGYAFGNIGDLNGYQIPGEGKIYVPFPAHLEKPLDIAMKATAGVACGGNETGYPTNVGYTRSFGATDPFGHAWSFWKTQLFAGAAGFVFGEHLKKAPLEIGMKVYMIGGPAYLIGKGGSQASSKMQDGIDVELDWGSVQRGNPLMSRKIAEVIGACAELGDRNPIASVHDQGAGGIGNILTELVAPLGAKLDLAKVTLGDQNLTPSDIWTAEYQERMGMVIFDGQENVFENICKNENLNCECLGEITGDGKIVVTDSRTKTTVIDLVLEDILGSVPRITITDSRKDYQRDWTKEVTLPKDLTLKEALLTVLKRIEVGSKDWHLRYKDHSVLGRTVLQPHTGPAYMPVNDCALSLISQYENKGGLVSIGEQPIMMIKNPRAAARMALLEAILNSAGVVINRSANQGNEMISVRVPGGYALAHDMLEAAKEMQIELDEHSNGGKDSTNMTVVVGKETVISPPQFVVSKYATVEDVKKRIPAHFTHPGNSHFLAINYSGSGNRYRLGGSPYLTAFDMPWNGETPDVDSVHEIVPAKKAVSELIEKGLITACHDTVGDGLLVNVIEMMLAGGCGAILNIDARHVYSDPGAIQSHAKAFAQEGWLIVEYLTTNGTEVEAALEDYQVSWQYLGETSSESKLVCTVDTGSVNVDDSKQDFTLAYGELWDAYNRTSMEMKKERITRAGGDTGLVAQERNYYHDNKGKEPYVYADFEKIDQALAANLPKGKAKALVLRAEGSNGQEELGFMFEMGGFSITHANMEMLLNREVRLKDFQQLLLPGGFSFGDLFGSGVAWANQFKHTWLWNDLLKFIADPCTLIFGDCNGYQTLSELDILYPELDPACTPRLVRNDSHLFEHHLNYLTIPKKTNVVFLKDMEGWVLPVYSAHGEGKHYFPDPDVQIALTSQGYAPIRFADHNGKTTEAYPSCPNGSLHGIAGMTSPNGRIFGMMPHPERMLLADNLPYMPKAWEGKLATFTPWILMAHNAYAWCLAHQ